MDNGDRIKIVGIFIVIFLILCGYFYLTQGRQNIQQAKLQKQQLQQNIKTSSKTSDNVSANDEKNSSSGIYYKVHVAGEVKNPGVYSLNSQSRVIDAIEIAGGNTDEADLDRINLAEYIKDGEKIRIPNINERNNSSNSLGSTYYDFNLNKLENIPGVSKNTNNYNLDANSHSKSELININTASVSKLEELPGVGSTIANSIISYREENGSFKTIEQLKEVPRIGDKTYDKLKDLICVD